MKNIRLRERQREMKTAWICCANITISSTSPREDSFPSTETSACTLSGMTHSQVKTINNSVPSFVRSSHIIVSMLREFIQI